MRAALVGEEPRKIPGKRAFCFFMGDQPYLREDTVSGFLDRYPFCGKGMPVSASGDSRAIRRCSGRGMCRNCWPLPATREAAG